MASSEQHQTEARCAGMSRVGLCEDDVAIRRVVNDAMRLAGHEVVSAHNGGEAIRLFVDDDALDVITLDIGLSDADGRDVCRALRTAGQPAPVLFLGGAGLVVGRGLLQPRRRRSSSSTRWLSQAECSGFELSPFTLQKHSER